MGIDFDEIERRHAADRRARGDRPKAAGDAPKPKPGSGPVGSTVGCLLGLAIVGVIAWAIVAAVTGNDDDTGPDASAQLACGHFRNVLDDVAAGVLTDAELREKAQEINDTASASTWPGVSAAARGFLAATTSGVGVLDATTDLADACSSVPSL